jgi:curli biogenesis system outer membrane secretion channel CsgG
MMCAKSLRILAYSICVLCAGCYSSTITKTDETIPLDSAVIRQRPPVPMDLRKKVAVLDFDDRTDYGQGRLGVSAANVLITYLDRSNQFAIYEREKLGGILNEQRFHAARSGDTAAAVEVGRAVGVDFVFIGAVTGYGYHSRSTDVLIFGSSVVQEAEATVDIRMVEVATGRIIASESGRGVVTIQSGQVLGVGTSAGYDETTASNALRAAISKYVDKMIDLGLQNR